MSVESIGAVTYADSAQTEVVAIAGLSLTSPAYFALLASKIDEVIVATTGIKAMELITSGALSISTALPYSHVSVTGTVAYTLADGTIEGQIKEIECTVIGGTPLGTLTLATPFTGQSAVHVFTAVGQRLFLVWRALGWKVIGKQRAGVQAVVVGTTVLTGYDMASVYALSVTGTVSSTTTKGIPAGQVGGERIHLSTPTVASTANGDIAITAVNAETNAACTSFGNIGNDATTASGMSLTWNGAAWVPDALPTGSATLA